MMDEKPNIPSDEDIGHDKLVALGRLLWRFLHTGVTYVDVGKFYGEPSLCLDGRIDVSDDEAKLIDGEFPNV